MDVIRVREDARPDRPGSKSREMLSEPLLRPEDVASLLGVKRSSVYEYARAGGLPCIKVGRHLRFLRADIEQWVLRRRRPR
jgi:excisionase family DNA binding protein